jgi:hypothetical protein
VSAFEVSAFEPAPPAEPKLDLPQFLIVLRGYDRGQVEEWGRELASRIQQQRLRADQAEHALYRMQLQQPATPSFTHLGARVGDVIEEAGRSAEKMLVDAAERAQEAVDAADTEAAQHIAAAEQRAAEIQRAARQMLKQAQAEGARVQGEARQAAAVLRAQAEQDARAVLEEVRQAAEGIWQQAERERVAVEGETRRLQGLRRRADEQLGWMYEHLAWILEGVGRGIDGIQDLGEEAEPEAAAEPVTRQPAVAVEPAEASSWGRLRTLEPVAAAQGTG